MALSAFDDKQTPPGEDDLMRVLGRSDKAWDRLKAQIGAEFQPVDEIWKFSGKAWGWSLQLKRKKRAVLYLTPQDRFFYAGFALGERAVAAARDASLPESVMEIIDSARRYVEGRAVRLDVRTLKDAAIVAKLAAIKMAN